MSLVETLYAAAARAEVECVEVVETAGEPVVCRVRRSRRRSMALQVDARQVRLALPWEVRPDQVRAFLYGHGEWLASRLKALRETRDSRAFRLQDGAVLPVLGRECRVRLHALPQVEPLEAWQQAGDGTEALHLLDGPGARKALVKCLQARALPFFRQRVAVYCARLGVSVPPVRLSSARTRWGSCSTRSGIRLHWRLVHLSPELIDYVVAHEVAHLLEMNHSPRFWSVVASLYPDWQTARKALREASRGLPVLD